jgi:hypothetical protein
MENSGMKNFAQIFKFVFIVGVAVIFSGGCNPTQPPGSIALFDVTPRNFCSVPQTIRVEWAAVGSEFTLDGLPALARTTVGPNGPRDVSIDQTTTFNLSASSTTGSQADFRRASQMSGTQWFQVTDSRAQPCLGGGWRLRKTVRPDEYASNVVVRRLRNPNTFPIQVTDPGGVNYLIRPGFSASTPLEAGELFGEWNIFMEKTDGVCPAPTEAPDMRFVAVDLEVGCPAQ